MKRILLIFMVLLLAGITFAQTQQGIVKTRGRVVNGQVVPGTKLSGATITLNIGNPQVSQAQGTFSFNVPSGKSFSLVSAKKQGYTLADPEYTRRTFKYSASNPFYVVLEDEAQRQADIKEATDKVRKTLKRELRKREDELDELRESNAITQAKYDSLRMEFATYRQSSEALVNEMAERFAAIDYDQLDEFNRQVQQYIEEGELLKADSLINTRGSLEERYARVKEQESVNTQREEEIRQQQESLAKSQELTQREKEDLMSDLYAKHTIYLQAYQQDSALYCLKMRADLDATNLEAVSDYAALCFKQRKYTDCEKYALGALRALREDDFFYRANLYVFLGLVYCNNCEFSDSERFYKDALEIQMKQFAIDPEFYRSDLAATQCNLGTLYLKLHDFVKSERYFKLALENQKVLFAQNAEKYRDDIANTLNNLGALYYYQNDFPNSEKYFLMALGHREASFRQNPSLYRGELANTQNNLGLLYYCVKDYVKSDKYYIMALEHQSTLLEQNPDAYRADLAITLQNLGSLYYDLQNYRKSEDYYKLALENQQILFSQNPNAYRPEYAQTLHLLGILYGKLHDFVNADLYCRQALSHREQLFKEYPDAYRADLANSYALIALLCADMGDIDQYDEYLEKALRHYEFLHLSYPSYYNTEIIGLWNRKVYRLLDKGNVTDAMDLELKSFALDTSNEQSKLYLSFCYYARSQININRSLKDANEDINSAIELMPTTPDFYTIKGEILLMQGRNDEALEMWKKVLELAPNFLDNYPDGTNLSNGLKKLGLIE